MKQLVAIKKSNRIYTNFKYHSSLYDSNDNVQHVASINAELMNIGYMLSESTFNALKRFPIDELVKLQNSVIPVLNELRGSHVVHKPMYKNFPQEVMEKSEFELYMNAIIHYWTMGEWMPESEEIFREYAFESTDFVELGLANDNKISSIVTDIILSKESISDMDKSIVSWYVDEVGEFEAITSDYKENICFYAALLFKKGRRIDHLLTTATDVLRFISYLSDGDVSLADDTKFTSMKRRDRRYLISVLENCINEDDISRHKNKWKNLFHMLHVGEYKKVAPKTFAIAQKVRNNEPLSTFNSEMEAKLLHREDISTILPFVKKRAGDFHRRLDHLLRTYKKDNDAILDAYKEVVEKVPNRLLMQMVGHLKQRSTSNEMYIFPKGNLQSASAVERKGTLKKKTIKALKKIVKKQLKANHSKLTKLGKVWIDPALKDCPLPTQQRSATDSALEVARGTHLDIGDDDFLRFFVYWVGQDIDLSASFHNEKFEKNDHVSYTNLKNADIRAFHSGDITRAPSGATEYIDISIDDALKAGHRYVVMNLYVYQGPAFNEHTECFSGYMTLNNPEKNKQFQPKKVKMKLDMTSGGKYNIPLVFDLKKRKAIWVDLNSNPRSRFGGNNIESNTLSTEETLEIIVKSPKQKYNLYDLFKAHGQARGKIVKDATKADTKFGIDDTNDVTIFNINEINSRYC